MFAKAMGCDNESVIQEVTRQAVKFGGLDLILLKFYVLPEKIDKTDEICHRRTMKNVLNVLLK